MTHPYRTRIKLALVTSVLDNREGRGTALVARELLSRLLTRTDVFDITLIHHEQTDDPLYTAHPTLLIPHLPAPFDRHLFREVMFWLTLRRRAVHFDIVHYLTPRIWPSYLLTPASAIVVSMHEAGIMLNLHPHSIADRIFQFTYRFLHQRITKVIAVSHFAKKEIATYCKIAAASIAVIPNAVNPTFARADMPALSAYLTEHFGIPSPYLLSVGRLDPHKNILRLVETYAQARRRGIQESLVLVGGRHLPAYSDAVERRIRELDLTEHIFLAPFIPDSDLPKVYTGARALIYPSLHEGFGLPLLEAMACGTPVAASCATALPEIAGGAALLFDPTDTEGLTESIVRILTDTHLRTTLSARGYARLKDFSWDKSVDALDALYRAISVGR